ncbi:MAG: HAMP domain-containing sensor histidine kinase [Hymenobacter sp.]
MRDASHELRTPLTALAGELEVALLQAERPATEYRRVLQRTLDAARQLTSLTNGLLQIAQASGDPRQRPCGPWTWASCCCWPTSRWAAATTSRVDVELGEGTEAGAFVVLGNEPLLLSALLNVLDNACKFSAAGGQPVTATLARPAGRPTLLVTDEGLGLAPPIWSRYSCRFFGRRRRGRCRATASGCPSARIMALHGGAVRLASEPGQGTRVWLEWPALLKIPL